MASALLLTTALASPVMAETLPEISPRQIASDVEVKFNPETGSKEYIAPSFDPFEEDRSMAGTASLRSVSSATTIDGQSVMTFYYNSASNDPYDTRGYEDAVYLSGEYAPVTRRDNRILECNEQVQDVVYYHEDYYRPSLYVNLFRPYRHYRGHYAYGGSYGYDYGRGYRSYRGYGGHRGYRGGRGYRRGDDRRRRRGTRNRDGGSFADRAIDRVREENGLPPRPREERGDRRNRNDGERSETRREERRANRANRNRNRDRAETRRGTVDALIGGPSRMGSNAGPAGRRTEGRRTVPPRATTPAQRAQRMERLPGRERLPRIESAPRVRNDSSAGAERAPVQGNSFSARAVRRITSRAATPRSAPAPRATAPAPRAERAAPTPRPRRAERTRPPRLERAVKRAREIKSRNAPRRNSGRKGNPKLRMMGFLPMASAWSRNVVRNVDVQCAREEMLTVHIPQERLDAARFDGLTVLVLDRTGQEIPVFVPPNYIEGFRQAVGGRVAPSVSYQEPHTSAPVTTGPVYQEPRSYGIEQAPCPAGTTKQNDGTCLQSGTVTYGGYPTR